MRKQATNMHHDPEKTTTGRGEKATGACGLPRRNHESKKQSFTRSQQESHDHHAFSQVLLKGNNKYISVGFEYARATWFVVASEKGESMERETRPGDPCPFFTDAECQAGCWLWDMEDAQGACSAWRVFPIGDMNPRDWYNEMMMEAAS